jgi:hypothetical protein
MKPLCLILVLALSFPACSRFSESARRQRAYDKCVRKSMVIRKPKQSWFSRTRAPQMLPTVAGPATEISTQENPQAVPSEQIDQ